MAPCPSLLAALLAAWLFRPGPVQAMPAFKAVVQSIGDGDSIGVIDAGKRLSVRLACIDAPELAQHPDGAMARAYLQSRLRIGSTVRLIPKDIDRYGRTVAEVIGAINLNLALVEDGQAFANRPYLNQCNAKEYLQAEYRASRRRLGVWQVPGGITRPWDFRRHQRRTGVGTRARTWAAHR